MDAAIRHLTLLSLLPREPRRIEARALRAGLAERGFPVDLRSVQRDLVRLSRVFPVVCTEGQRPYGWSWARTAPPFGSAGLDPTMALALVLAGSWLDRALPPSMRRALDPVVAAARRVLDAHGGRGGAGFARRLRVLPHGPPVVAPAVDPGTVEAVTRALATRRRLAARTGPSGRAWQSLVLDPLGLVWRGGAMFLVARAAGVAAVRAFPLHRLRAVELLESPADDRGFDLDAWLAEGDGPAADRETVRLVARVRADLVRAFEDAPLAVDQAFERVSDDEGRLTASVRDTPALRAWLLGFADGLVVEAPAALAEALAEAARAMVARYEARPAERGGPPDDGRG